MALVLAVLMIAAMVPAGLAEVPTNGSITVNSPIVGATYTAYKVFDMSVNDGVTSFAYTIDDNNPFFNTVKTYANMPAQLPDANADGLTLTVTADTATATVKTYNVAVTDAFDPQAFGQALLAALKGDATADPAVAALDASSVAETPIKVTVANSELIQFTGLELGYFLITSEYPTADFSKVTLTEKKYDGTAKTDPAVEHVYNKDSVDPEAETLALTSAAKADIETYVTNVVDDDYVTAYIADKNLKDKDANGNEIAIAKDSDRWNEVKTEIINSMKADAEAQILNALKNQLEGSESEINLAKDPILVFLDSSQPDAVINEKNEIDKWDVPVNPSGDALPKDLPDHGEPDGGKNIVINEDPVVYANWTEANIGDSIHYQLRVNAMNFVREGDGSDEAVQTTADKVQQVKEYWLADYRNPNMHFDTNHDLQVTVVNGNGQDVTVGKTTGKNYIDYTGDVAKFFANGTGNEDEPNKTAYTAGSDVLKKNDNSVGIMVPWVGVTQKESDVANKVYTTSTVVKKNDSGETIYQKAEDGDTESKQDAEGYLLDKDNQKIPEVETYYVYCLYNSDVTIVVDYWMILDDTAVIDGEGNPNYAQYAYTPVEPKDTKPNTPDKTKDKPSELKEVDEAIVYTYAIGFVKVDNKAEALQGATFQLPFYVKKNVLTDGTYVHAFDELPTTFADGDSAANYTNSVTSPDDGVITIKGVKSGEYSITETAAPAGYNKLAEPFTVEAKKTGETTITETTKTIYLDAQGNVVKEEVTGGSTITTHTTDSNLPVYQFLPVVNQQGTELPSTGGMGTTIFYVAGSILVLAAAILLITKRRMGAEN